MCIYIFGYVTYLTHGIKYLDYKSMLANIYFQYKDLIRYRPINYVLKINCRGRINGVLIAK